MAAPCTLWLALVLLGALGVLQTPAQVRASVQPDFQKDKVRRSPARSPRWDRALSREGGASALAVSPGKRWVSPTRREVSPAHVDTPATCLPTPSK